MDYFFRKSKLLYDVESRTGNVNVTLGARYGVLHSESDDVLERNGTISWSEAS